MKSFYNINDPEFEEIFHGYSIKDLSVQGRKLPFKWQVNRDMADGMNTLDMVLYNLFLEQTGFFFPSFKPVFLRIDRDDLMYLMNCGAYSLSASIKRLQEKKCLVVLQEVGKENAYLART